MAKDFSQLYINKFFHNPAQMPDVWRLKKIDFLL